MAFVAEQLLLGALTSNDPTYTSNFYNAMAPFFAMSGYALSPYQFVDFDKFAKSDEVGLSAHFTRVLGGEKLTEVDFPSLKCAACKVSSYAVAGLIVAAGAAALSYLTVGSSIVIALAGIAGVSLEAALAFAVTLGGVVSGGVGKVVEAICEWVGVC